MSYQLEGCKSEGCKSSTYNNGSGLDLPMAATLSSEIERLFKVLSEVESKVFPPTPNCVKECDTSDNNLVNLRNDISSIADRLSYVNEALTFIGK